MSFLIVYGNPINGFTYNGPFSTYDDANDWADNNVTTEYDWWVAPMQAGTEKTMLDYTPHMTDKQLYEAAYAMRSGGSFALAISDAFFVADKHNRKKLLAAFGDLFVEFAHTPNQGETK